MSAFSHRNYLAEFLGAAFVVFVVISTHHPIAIGAAVAIVYAVAQSTVNPAAAIAMVHYKVFDPRELVPTIIVQTLGALVAVEFYKNLH